MEPRTDHRQLGARRGALRRWIGGEDAALEEWLTDGVRPIRRRPRALQEPVDADRRRRPPLVLASPGRASAGWDRPLPCPPAKGAGSGHVEDQGDTRGAPPHRRAQSAGDREALAVARNSPAIEGAAVTDLGDEGGTPVLGPARGVLSVRAPLCGGASTAGRPPPPQRSESGPRPEPGPSKVPHSPSPRPSTS